MAELPKASTSKLDRYAFEAQVDAELAAEPQLEYTYEDASEDEFEQEKEGETAYRSDKTKGDADAGFGIEGGEEMDVEKEGGEEDKGEGVEEDEELDTGLESAKVRGQPAKAQKKSRKYGGLKGARLQQSKMGLFTQKAFAGGYEDLESRDRLLIQQLPAEIEASAQLHNLQTFKSAAEKFDWSKTAFAPRKLLPIDIDELLSMPAQRSLRYTVVKDEFIAWKTGMAMRESASMRMSVKRPWMRMKGRGKEFKISKEQQEQIGTTLRSLLERWPTSVDGRSNGSLRSNFQELAISYHFPDLPPMIPVIHLDNTGSYELWANHFVGTVQRKNVKIAISPQKIDMQKSIPNLPEGTLWATREGKGKNDREWVLENPLSPPEGLSEEDEQRHKRCMLVLAWVAISICNRHFESDGAFGGYLRHMCIVYGGSTAIQHKRIGVYKGKNLYTLNRVDLERTFIDLSAAARYDLALRPRSVELRVTVHSTKWAAVNVVTDTLSKTYLHAGKLRDAMFAAARAADEVNQSLSECVLLRAECQHPRDDRPPGCGHGCDGCGAFTDCDKLETHPDGARLCETCEPRRQDEQEISLQKLLHGRLRSALSAEGIDDAADVKDRIQAIMSSVPGSNGLLLDPPEVDDYYLPGYKRGNPKERSQKLSLDAKFPVAVSPDGTIGYHVPSNVVGTAQWVNLGKSTFTPGQIALAIEIETVKQGIASEKNATKRAALENRLEQLLEQEDILFQLTLKTPYAKKARFASIDKSTVEKRIFELKTGKAIRSSSLPMARQNDHSIIGGVNERFVSAPTQNWVPGVPGDFESRLRPLIDLILAAGNIVPAYGSIDDCPFPGPADAVPHNWCWWTAWCFFGVRLMRMWLWCNGKWIIVDTTETIYLTCLWHWVTGLRGVDRFDWVFWVRHLRRIAVCHQVHGEQMRGLFLRGASTLEHMRADPNMEFTTAFENYAISNYSKAEVDQIAKELPLLRIPQDDWNPDAPKPIAMELQKMEQAAELEDVVESQNDAIVPGRSIEFEEGDEAEEPEERHGNQGEEDDEDEDDAEAGDRGKGKPKAKDKGKGTKESETKQTGRSTGKAKQTGGGKAADLEAGEDDEEAEPPAKKSKGKGVQASSKSTAGKFQLPDGRIV